ncbi:helix-turn-helix domain-containing protein [Tabrizicola sp.]|uniref:helix-turn-helix domain-containing protein n=1 Tax=Tabrizicola sp. TaxID=2005166 RepID=UPI003D280E4B
MANFPTEKWFSDDVATLGDRLEAARNAAGLTQRQLAQRLGVRDTTVAAWEADRQEPRGNRMQMIAGMLNVSLMWLMTGEGDGIDSPVVEKPADVPFDARTALADLARLHQQLQDLSHEMAVAQFRLETHLRERAE